MVEYEVATALHRFRACEGCQRQPLHVRVDGRTNEEAARTEQNRPPCHRHYLECPRCQRRTLKHATLELAEQEWGVKYAALTLALPVPIRRRGAA